MPDIFRLFEALNTGSPSMNTFSISTLLGLTTVIALAFSLGQFLDHAPTLSVYLILYCVWPIACQLIGLLSPKRLAMPSYAPVASVLIAGSFLAYVFAGGKAILPALVCTLLVWTPQLLVMQLLSSCRPDRLWYLYLEYYPPSDAADADPM